MLISTYQHTVKSPADVSGIGLHSGADVTLCIKPGNVNTGIVFVRTDITDRDNAVPAKWDNVTETTLCTVISNKAGAKVSTVEHVLSACAAAGIDNAVIEVSGPEVPIMDGSAREFLDAIDRAGTRKQAALRKVLRVKKAVTYAEGDKQVTLSPAATPVYALEIDFGATAIGRQSFTHRFRADAYRTDIASARTFCLMKEVEYMRSLGLIKGGSLDNAVVVDGDKVLNEGGLRFPEEFVRHKILDAIGDLFLAGYQMIGRYDGLRAGHALNNKALRALFATPDAYEIVELGTEAEAPRKVAAAGRRVYTDLPVPAVA